MDAACIPIPSTVTFLNPEASQIPQAPFVRASLTMIYLRRGENVPPINSPTHRDLRGR